MTRLTRRRLLAGGGAALGAGAAGVVTLAHPRALWNRVAGACGSEPPRPPASGARLVAGAFRSASVPSEVGYMLALPRGARDEPLPVCICLPGRGMSAGESITSLHLHDHAAEAVRRAGIRPYALAAVDGGESYWHRRATGEDRMAMLFDEFLPMIERRGLGAAGTGRAIMGWSMGGYGALLATATHQGAFRATVAESPAVWTSYERAVSDAFDGRADWAAHDIFGRIAALGNAHLKIDAGRSDPFAGAVAELRRRLAPRPAGAITDGCHDGTFWRRMAASSTAFVGVALA